MKFNCRNVFFLGHEESYNPPPEYLFTEEEKKKWELAKEGGGRLKLPYIPQKYSALRKVPGWSNFIKVGYYFPIYVVV